MAVYLEGGVEVSNEMSQKSVPTRLTLTAPQSGTQREQYNEWN